MSTYYKYAERAVENTVDWSVIGKNFTDMLKTESELREKKKSDIEKATNETLQSLANSPTGLDKGVNENILNFSSQTQDYLLMMNRLLKSGQLDPKDYNIYTQNLKSGTNKLFSAAKLYQENYKKNIERANATGPDRASAQELWLRTQVENAANFSKSQIYINNNGNISVGLPTKDPATGQYVLNNDPNSYKTVEALNYAATVDINPLDVDSEVKAVVDGFGKNIITDMKLTGRMLRTVSDVTARKDYAQAESNYIKSILAKNNNNGASILSDWMQSKDGNQYEFTSNPNDPRIKSNTAILMVADPSNPTSGRLVPKLSAQQEKEAEEFLRQRIRIGIDREIQGQYIAPPAPRRAEEKKEKTPLTKEQKYNLYGDYINSIIGTIPVNESDAQTDLENKFAELGFAFEQEKPGYDYIKVSAPNETSILVDLKGGDVNGSIADFIKLNTPIGTIDNAISMGIIKNVPSNVVSNTTVSGGNVR